MFSIYLSLAGMLKILIKSTLQYCSKCLLTSVYWYHIFLQYADTVKSDAVFQLVARLTQELEVPCLIPSPVTYFVSKV